MIFYSAGHMVTQYTDWMSSGSSQEYTAGGNLRPDTKQQLVEWVKIAWGLLEPDLIMHSYQACGILLLDSESVSHITCLKADLTAQAVVRMAIQCRDQGDGDPFETQLTSNVSEEEDEEDDIIEI